MYYLFSYGSNHTEQLRKRIESPDDILSSEVVPAYADNYIRIFAGFSSLWQGAVASIHPYPGKRVYGTLRIVSQRQLDQLDVYEGGYTRTVLPIINQLTNEPMHAYVYIKNKTTFTHMPSEAYLHAIATQLHETNRIHKPTILIRAIDDNHHVSIVTKWNPVRGFTPL